MAIFNLSMEFPSKLRQCETGFCALSFLMSDLCPLIHLCRDCAGESLKPQARVANEQNPAPHPHPTTLLFFLCSGALQHFVCLPFNVKILHSAQRI